MATGHPVPDDDHVSDHFVERVGIGMHVHARPPLHQVTGEPSPPVSLLHNAPAQGKPYGGD